MCDLEHLGWERSKYPEDPYELISLAPGDHPNSWKYAPRM